MTAILHLAAALLETVVTAAASAVSGLWWLVAESLPLVPQVILYVLTSMWYILSTLLQTAVMAVLMVLDVFSSAFHFGLPHVEDWWAWSVEAIPIAIDYVIAGTYSLYSGISTGISTGFGGAWNIGTFFVDDVIPLVVAAVNYTFQFLWFLLTSGFSAILWIISTVSSTCSLLLSNLITPWKTTEDFPSDSISVLHTVVNWVAWLAYTVTSACILVFLVVIAALVVYKLVPYCLALQQWLKHKMIHSTPPQRPQAQQVQPHLHQDLQMSAPPAQAPPQVLQRRPLTQPAPPAGGSVEQHLQHELVCVVCLDKEREMMLKPCNHLCVCGECVQRLNHKCPLCTRAFRGWERVYT